jgi:hypothetical protein
VGGGGWDVFLFLKNLSCGDLTLFKHIARNISTDYINTPGKEEKLTQRIAKRNIKYSTQLWAFLGRHVAFLSTMINILWTGKKMAFSGAAPPCTPGKRTQSYINI